MEVRLPQSGATGLQAWPELDMGYDRAPGLLSLAGTGGLHLNSGVPSAASPWRVSTESPERPSPGLCVAGRAGHKAPSGRQRGGLSGVGGDEGQGTQRLWGPKACRMQVGPRPGWPCCGPTARPDHPSQQGRPELRRIFGHFN